MSDWKPPTDSPDIKPPSDHPKPLNETGKNRMQGLDPEIKYEQNYSDGNPPPDPLEELDREIEDLQNYYQDLANHRSKIQKNGMDAVVDENVLRTTQEMERTAKRLGELAKKRREMSGLSW